VPGKASARRRAPFTRARDCIVART
jgi:hypothetical protein